MRARPKSPILLAALALPLVALLPACSVTSPVGSFTVDPIPLPTVRSPAPPERPRAAPDPGWERIGTSIRGRPLRAAQFGEGARRIYIVGGLRGDEPEAPAAAEHLAQLLHAEPIPGATVRVFQDVNPDGTARASRTNTRGVDLARNFPTADLAESFDPEVADAQRGRRPASELETGTLLRDLRQFNPDLVIVLSSSARGPRILTAEVTPLVTSGSTPASAPMGAPPDPGAPPPQRTVAAELLRPSLVVDFARAARAHDPRWRAVPHPQGTPSGTLAALTAGEWSRPTLTIEFLRRSDAASNARAVKAALAGGPE